MSVGTREKVREKAFAAAESSIASTSSGAHSCSQDFQLPPSKRLAKMMIRNTTPLHEDLVCSRWPVQVDRNALPVRSSGAVRGRCFEIVQHALERSLNFCRLTIVRIESHVLL